MQSFSVKTGALAILIAALAAVSFAPLSADAAMLVRNRKQKIVSTTTSITLAELINNQLSIQVGDKVFENWRGFGSVAFGGAAVVDPSQVTVLAVGEGTCDPGPGVRFVSTQFAVTGIAQRQITTISYDVRTTNGAPIIMGVRLGLDSFEAVLAGAIDVTETVMDTNQIVIATLAVQADSFGVTPSSSNDVAVLAPPQSRLSITKNIQLSNGGAEDQGSASLGEFGQNFSQQCPPTFLNCTNGTNNLGCNPTAASFSCDPGVTATGTCGSVTVTCIEEAIASNGCLRTRTLTYTATDACSNTATCVQTFNWTVDTTPPTFVNCTSGTTELGCNPPPASFSCDPSVTATDNCGSATVTCAEGSILADGCLRTRTLTYTATDGCGNTATCERTFTWTRDITPPAFNNCTPGTTELGCNPPAASFSCDPSVTATDDCGSATVTCAEDPILADGCRRTRTLTYTATDGCGNTATCVRTFTWTRDITPPTFNNCVPGTTELGCNPPAASFSCDPTVTASDDCGPATVTCQAGEILSDGCRRTRTLTYTATDSCGSTATCVRTFTWIRDIAAPVLSGVPSNTTVQCLDSVPAPATVTATDDCNGMPPVVFEESQSRPGSSCSNIVTRTWTATDSCGNRATGTQRITVSDTTPPTIIQCASNITICASQTVPSPDTSLVQATDNCGGPVTVTVRPDVITGSCPQIRSRVYVATDACGNQATCTQIITVNCNPVCNLAPPIPLPACGSAGNTLSGPAGFVSYSWSDNGSSSGWMITAGANTQTITYTAGASGTGVFTLTVTDANGCSSTCQVRVGCGATMGTGARVTGGGTVRPGSSQPACIPTAPAQSVSHGGQVGAPLGVPTPFTPASDCIRGEWQHDRHGNRRSLVGSFHAAGNGNVRQFDSLMAACLPCPENPAAGGTVGELCNPADRVCGPEPRRAPASKVCFSGVGDYSFTKGRKTLKAVFRVDVEDRGEPGGSKGPPPPDRYRLRLWILDPTCGRAFGPDSQQGMALRQAVACANPLTETVEISAGPPDIDDGGDLLQGNQQIHPLTGANCP